MNSQPGKAIPIVGISKEQVSEARVTARGLPLASIGLRCAAFLLDYILMMITPAVAISIALLFKRVLPDVAWIILYVGYAATFGLIMLNWVYLVRQDGQTLGKRILGIRIVRRDGRLPDYKATLLRHLVGYPLGILSLGLGFCWMLWDVRQQGWHDKLAETVVVRQA